MKKIKLSVGDIFIKKMSPFYSEPCENVTFEQKSFKKRKTEHI